MDVNTEFKDRKRFTYKAEIYHDSLSPDVFYAATMHNFSRGGLYFESDQSLDIGDYINLRIKHPPHSSGKDNLYELGVEITWRKSLRYSSFRYGYGAKFIKSLVDASCRNAEIRFRSPVSSIIPMLLKPISPVILSAVLRSDFNAKS